MARLFISYRRDDSADATGRVYDRLTAAFGKNAVFKDVDSIPAGMDFREVVDSSLDKCDIALVVIGRFWTKIKNPDGGLRLHDPGDWVRLEVEQSLARDSLVVVPLLLSNARMPLAEDLPTTLRPLTYRNAIRIRPDPDFHRDMDQLIVKLKGQFKEIDADKRRQALRRRIKGPAEFGSRRPTKKCALETRKIILPHILACPLFVLGSIAFDVLCRQQSPIHQRIVASIMAWLINFLFVAPLIKSDLLTPLPLPLRLLSISIVPLTMAVLFTMISLNAVAASGSIGVIVMVALFLAWFFLFALLSVGTWTWSRALLFWRVASFLLFASLFNMVLSIVAIASGAPSPTQPDHQDLRTSLYVAVFTFSLLLVNFAVCLAARNAARDAEINL